MSFTPVFVISQITPTSFLFKDVTPMDTTIGYGAPDAPESPYQINTMEITATAYDETTVYTGTIDPSTAIQQDFQNGLKINMDVPDGVTTFTVRYGQGSLFIGSIFWYPYVHQTMLVTAKADVCIFAAVDVVSLQDRYEPMQVANALKKIFLKEAGLSFYSRGLLTKADEAIRLVCGKQPYSPTSICNCD